MSKSVAGDNKINKVQDNNPIKAAYSAQNSTETKPMERQGKVNPIVAIDSATKKTTKKTNITPATNEDIQSLSNILKQYINSVETTNTRTF